MGVLGTRVHSAGAGIEVPRPTNSQMQVLVRCTRGDHVTENGERTSSVGICRTGTNNSGSGVLM
jgi:hypothetical protein